MLIIMHYAKTIHYACIMHNALCMLMQIHYVCVIHYALCSIMHSLCIMFMHYALLIHNALLLALMKIRAYGSKALR